MNFNTHLQLVQECFYFNATLLYLFEENALFSLNITHILMNKQQIHWVLKKTVLRWSCWSTFKSLILQESADWEKAKFRKRPECEQVAKIFCWFKVTFDSMSLRIFWSVLRRFHSSSSNAFWQSAEPLSADYQVYFLFPLSVLVSFFSVSRWHELFFLSFPCWFWNCLFVVDLSVCLCV